jgi:hypothetical protein
MGRVNNAVVGDGVPSIEIEIVLQHYLQTRPIAL